MDIKNTKRTLMGLPPKKSVFIEGGHGLGKSEVVAQTAKEMSIITDKPFQFIDLRLSQREVGDMIGMPRSLDSFEAQKTVYENGVPVTKTEIIKNVTVHDLPVWFPTDPNSYGYLFLDELDRATRDVQQAAFELVLDYRMNFHHLPKGWRVIAAGNKNTDVYNVLEMCPALYDRFLIIDFRPTVQEWQNHAEKIGVHDAVLKYISKFKTSLDTPENIEPGKRYPSRRSWVQLSETITYMIAQGDNVLRDTDYLTLLSKGYLGEAIAINFVDFIVKDYKVFSAEEILNNFSELKPEFEKMIATDFTFYNGEIIGYIKKESIKLNKKQSDNLFKYVQTIPKEVASGFWGEFLKDCQQEATRWYKDSEERINYIAPLIVRSL